MSKLLLIGLILSASCNAELLDKGFSFNSIKLEKSTFNDIFKIFGKSEIFKKGEASTYSARTCFETKDHKILLFGSSEVMQGGMISEIFLYPKKTELEYECRKIDTNSIEIKFKNKISLGSSRNSLEQLLGKPFKVKNDLYTYLFETKLKDGFTELLTIDVEFDDEQNVQKLYVYKVTSN